MPTKMPKAISCPHCNETLAYSSHLTEDKTAMHEGDYAVCAHCIKVSRFRNGNLVIEDDSTDEVDQDDLSSTVSLAKLLKDKKK
jgi:hypothetical protein